VNWSAGLVALVPPGPVTVTSTVLCTAVTIGTETDPTWSQPPWGGEVTVNDVELLTLTPVAVTDPNLTVSPGAKFVPLTVTVVPPVNGPFVGLTPDTVGVAGGGGAEPGA